MKSCLLQNPFPSSYIHIHVLCVKVDLSLSLEIQQLDEPPGSAGILKANVTNSNKSSLQTLKLCDNVKGMIGGVGEAFWVNFSKRNVLAVVHSVREGWPPSYWPPPSTHGPSWKPEPFILQSGNQRVLKICWLDSVEELLSDPTFEAHLEDFIVCENVQLTQEL